MKENKYILLSKIKNGSRIFHYDYDNSWEMDGRKLSNNIKDTTIINDLVELEIDGFINGPCTLSGRAAILLSKGEKAITDYEFTK